MRTLGFSVGSWATLKPYLPFIVPLALIELGLMIAALIHIFTHKTYKIGNRWIWVIVSILFNIIGPVLYFILGRSDEEKDDEDESGDQCAGTNGSGDAL